MKEQEIGFVSNYFSQISVAAIEMTKGKLKTGDTIHIKGHTTDFEEIVKSLQIEHADISEAKAGDSIGLKVSQHVRKKDKVYKVIED
ncbi:MAG: translation elongation factor-like protein [Candidatus Marinimicrobia bacterium]|nr:translation elongation factor-like protein [Candidatus Neomarinimicrobiota bacterium]MBL7047105.1 translation elongation factor-like protein [Candidatus Neomarinimicrobiota bacterium]